MTVNVWITLSVVFALILFGIIIIVAKKTQKPEHEPSYRAFFVIGLIWLPTGVATRNYALSIIGGTFLIIGLLNKGKWKDEKKWSDLSHEDKRIKLTVVLIALLAILVIGITTYMFVKI